MATRQQQRRGTSEQWSTANPILAAGEIGYETDTNEFRIGDGVNRWNDLSPFKNLQDLGGTLDDYIPLTARGAAGGVASLDVYGSIPVSQLPNADALDAEVDSKVQTHNQLTHGVHGITDTGQLATVSYIGDAIDSEITNRNQAIGASASATFESATDYTDTAISTEVIDRNDAIGAAIATEVTHRNSAINTAMGAANDYTDSEIGTLSSSLTDDIATAKSQAITAAGSAADSKVATEVTNRNSAISTHNSATTSVHGIADTAALATKVYADNAVSTHESDTTSVHGIADTSALATKSYADNSVSTHEQDTTNIHGIADTSALATKTYADNAASTAVAAVIDAAPAALDTLNELAAALGDNANYATTVTNALALKAPLASPTFTGTVSGVTKSMVGLGSVENTADADKPVSSATRTALDLKANLASPTFTGTVTLPAGTITSGMILDGTIATVDLADSAVTSAKISDSAVTSAKIADLTIVDGDINASAAIAKTKIAGTAVVQSDLGTGVATFLATPSSANLAAAITDEVGSNKLAFTTQPILAYPEIASTTFLRMQSNANIQFQGATVDSNLTTLDVVDPTANRTILLPNVSGTVITTGDTGTVTSTMIADGTIVNADISGSAAIDQSKISGLSTSLGLKADLASPALTGTPTAPTATAGTNTTQVATTAFVGTAVSNLVAAAPSALDTLKELADALTADESTAATLATLVGTKAPSANPTFTGTVSGITKSMVGLGSVDNTADTAKPISTATQTALDAKLASATAATTYAPIASPTFTGTVTGVTKAHVGLGSVDNTTDAAKPVSTATQTALDLKANLASPTFTGTVAGITKSMVGLGSVDNTADTAKPVSTAQQTALDAKAPLASPTFTGTVSGITKSMVGLGSVDNTADTAKPISTATQTALDAKAPLASPGLTGTPTAPTASAGTNTTQVATTAFVGTAVANLVASAPSALDTLNELATALGNDANFSTTLTTNLGLKAPKADPTFTGTVTVSASGVAFTDGTQTKEGTPSRTPILQKTGSYTLSALTERDNMIEVSSATAVTITIPANSAVAYPVGTSIDILQTSTGQVTIAAGAGVTVNATPGLKLRTQWSSATLFKRASDTWVVYGDLSA
jgi:hypothetical protein